MSTIAGASSSTAEPGKLGVELNGINVIAEDERKGAPRDLFWPWFAANISVLAIPYGAFILGFKVSFWQAAIAGVVGVILSFALCGVVALAGKRGSAPTMVLSRAAFGVDGNRLPAFLSWILLVGWETVLVSLSALATATVFTELGWGGGTFTKIVAFLVTAALVVFAGVLGFDVIMRLQAIITVATASAGRTPPPTTPVICRGLRRAEACSAGPPWAVRWHRSSWSSTASCSLRRKTGWPTRSMPTRSAH
jgi:NCS1 family nucleobase:cation symporter-1